MSATPPAPAGSPEAAAQAAKDTGIAAKAREMMEKNQKRASDELAKIEAEGKKILKSFYARINGMTHYFKDGTVAKFIGGEFHAFLPHQVEELNSLVSTPGNHFISDQKVPVQNPEGVHILKEVGQGAGTGVASTNNLGSM
jgi:hypothetical protein